MENKLARFMRNTGPARFFIPVGLLLIVFGVILYGTTPKEYGQTEGTVTGVTSYVDEGKTKYDLEFEYTVDGKTYNGSFPDQGDGHKTGEKVTVYYDPANPESTSNSKHTGLIAIVMGAAGALALVYGILATSKAVRKSREMDEQIRSATGSREVPSAPPVPKDELTEYYVRFDGRSLRPGYIVEDRYRKTVYTAEMTKNAMVGARSFTFTDQVSGQSRDHQVGHTGTQTYNNEFFSTRSTFKFDDKDIWDLLHGRGVRIVTDLHSKFPKAVYTVSENGRFLATVENSSIYVHEEDEAQHKVAVPAGRYYYRFWTEAEDLELIVLTIFAISETEQAVVE